MHRLRSTGVQRAVSLPAVGKLVNQPGYAALVEEFGRVRVVEAIREQVATDRPPGIAALHAALARSRGGAHAAEHAMIEPLAETLWEAQRSGKAADEAVYLERLRRL